MKKAFDMSLFGEKFSAMTQHQALNNCGPCSLSYCLYLLGIPANQRQIRNSIGFMRVLVSGASEDELKQSASNFGCRCDFLEFFHKGEFDDFYTMLKRSAAMGAPAVVLTRDFHHWMAVVGAVDNQLIVCDPLDKNKVLRRVGPKASRDLTWNEDDKYPSQYFAMTVRRKDGKRPMLRIREKSMIKIMEYGSNVTAHEMVNDLYEIAGTTPVQVVPNVEDLAKILIEHKRTIIESAWNWSYQTSVTKKELISQMDDYITVAVAGNIPVKNSSEHIVGGMVAILCMFLVNEGIL